MPKTITEDSARGNEPSFLISKSIAVAHQIEELPTVIKLSHYPNWFGSYVVDSTHNKRRKKKTRNKNWNVVVRGFDIFSVTFQETFIPFEHPHNRIADSTKQLCISMFAEWKEKKQLY